MKGQVFAITLVVMSGVATFIMFITTMDSLDYTRNKFYRDYNFAEAFVHLRRAPESLIEKIKEIEGVRQAETRVMAQVKLDVSGFNEPVNARIISIPDSGTPCSTGFTSAAALFLIRIKTTRSSSAKISPTRII